MKNETLGQVFQRYRQADKIKLEKIEQDLKISRKIIQALENDDFAILPDELYTRHIIKAYANYLSLDFNKLLVLYEKGLKDFKSDQEKKPKQKKMRIYLTPQGFRNGIIVLIIILLLSYLGWQINHIYTPPELIIYQPQEDLIIQENYIEIKGKTAKEARVFVNEKEIFADAMGEFAASIDLQNGLNIIKISAAKKNSKPNIVFREILVQ